MTIEQWNDNTSFVFFSAWVIMIILVVLAWMLTKWVWKQALTIKLIPESVPNAWSAAKAFWARMHFIDLIVLGALLGFATVIMMKLYVYVGWLNLLLIPGCYIMVKAMGNRKETKTMKIFGSVPIDEKALLKQAKRFDEKAYKPTGKDLADQLRSKLKGNGS